MGQWIGLGMRMDVITISSLKKLHLFYSYLFCPILLIVGLFCGTNILATLVFPNSSDPYPIFLSKKLCVNLINLVNMMWFCQPNHLILFIQMFDIPLSLHHPIDMFTMSSLLMTIPLLIESISSRLDPMFSQLSNCALSKSPPNTPTNPKHVDKQCPQLHPTFSLHVVSIATYSIKLCAPTPPEKWCF